MIKCVIAYELRVIIEPASLPAKLITPVTNRRSPLATTPRPIELRDFFARATRRRVPSVTKNFRFSRDYPLRALPTLP